MSVQPTDKGDEHRRHPDVPGDPEQVFLAGAIIGLALFGLGALAVISRNGGSIAVSETGLSINVNAPVGAGCAISR